MPGTWRQGLERLLNNTIDMMPDVTYTDARKERFEFSRRPVIVSWSRIYVHGRHVFQPINIRFAFPKSGTHTPVLVPAVGRAMEILQQEPDSLYYRLLARHFETGVAEKVVEVWPPWLSLSLVTAIVEDHGGCTHAGRVRPARDGQRTDSLRG